MRHMKNPAQSIAAEIYRHADEIVEEVARSVGSQHDELMRHFELGPDTLRDHCRNHISYLAEAIRLGEETVYTSYVEWEAAVLLRRGLPVVVVRGNLFGIRDAILKCVRPDMRRTIVGYLALSIRLLDDPSQLPQDVEPPQLELAPLAKEYLHELLSGDRRRARTLIFQALEEGMDVRELYLSVLQPVQQEVGRLWEINAISVAQEHYCTAVTQLVVSQLYPDIMTGPKNGLVLVASCVGRELHELGLRMVADFFELDGWDSRFFGANMPVDQVVAAIVDAKADVLAVSTTMLGHIDNVRQLVAQARSKCEKELRILVGGYPFNQLPDLWKTVGADATARDAREAVDVVDRMFSRG